MLNRPKNLPSLKIEDDLVDHDEDRGDDEKSFALHFVEQI